MLHSNPAVMPDNAYLKGNRVTFFLSWISFSKLISKTFFELLEFHESCNLIGQGLGVSIQNQTKARNQFIASTNN